MRGLVWIVFLYGCEAGKASSEEAEENTSLDSEEDLEQDTGDESQEVELSCPEDLEGGVLTTSGCMVGTEMEYRRVSRGPLCPATTGRPALAASPSHRAMGGAFFGRFFFRLLYTGLDGLG